MPQTSNLFNDLIALANDCFGPDITSSIEARLEHELAKPLVQLTPTELINQLAWLKSIAGLFCSDTERVEAFALKARSLALDFEST